MDVFEKTKEGRSFVVKKKSSLLEFGAEAWQFDL